MIRFTFLLFLLENRLSVTATFSNDMNVDNITTASHKGGANKDKGTRCVLAIFGQKIHGEGVSFSIADLFSFRDKST